MKLLNDIDVHTYVCILSLYIATIYIARLLVYYNDYAGILEYPVFSPL